MNLLAKVKLSNSYDLVVSNLYEEDTPSGEDKVSITDVEGTTALLTTDGTSWEYTDADWQQIEIAKDQEILNSLYPFFTSICNSIQNSFVKLQLSAVYQEVTVSIEEGIATISDLDSAPRVQIGDFIILADYVKKYAVGDTVDYQDSWDYQTELASDLYGIVLPDEPLETINTYLTTVTDADETSISFDNLGVDMRISGETRTIGVFFVSFPQDFINAAISMLGYDMFIRESKEKNREALGNYTYSNFAPAQYYGDGEYPKNLQNKIKYWQKIYI